MIELIYSNISQFITDQLYHRLALLIFRDYPEYIAQVSIFITAISIVIFSCIINKQRPYNSLKPTHDHPLYHPTDLYKAKVPFLSLDPDEDEDEEDDEFPELTLTGAILMPIGASITLYSLYYAMKNWDMTKLLYYLQQYTVFMAAISIYITANSTIKFLSRHFENVWGLEYYKIVLGYDDEKYGNGHKVSTKDQAKGADDTKDQSQTKGPPSKKEKKIFISSSEILSTIISIIITYTYNHLNNSSSNTTTDQWILTNIIGLSMTSFGIMQINIGNFKTAVILLLGLFLYDIYFVFKTEMMVTVATNLEIPAKLSFPRLGNDPAKKFSSAIIGLGDLVIPGAFCALCLKFDLFQHHNINRNTEFHHRNGYKKPYFVVSVIAYAIGLTLTMLAVEVYHVGQPALLYIVPSLLLAVVLQSVIRGEFWELWRFKASQDTESESKSKSKSKSDSESESEEPNEKKEQ